MKTITFIFSFLVSINCFSQIVIATNNNVITNNSVLLNFEKTNNRGLLLPAVNAITSITQAGTLVLDATNANTSQIKLRKNGTTWYNFGRNNGVATPITSNRPNTIDYTDAKVVLGSSTSNVSGALVLESATQTMVLPEVSDINNIVNPSPGMIVYLNQNKCTSYTVPCVDKFLALYNGTEWSFYEAN